MHSHSLVSPPYTGPVSGDPLYGSIGYMDRDTVAGYFGNDYFVMRKIRIGEFYGYDCDGHLISSHLN